MHTVFSVHKFLMKNKTPKVPQPKFDPDPSPADFFLSPKWKVNVTRCQLESVKKTQKNG